MANGQWRTANREWWIGGTGRSIFSTDNAVSVVTTSHSSRCLDSAFCQQTGPRWAAGFCLPKVASFTGRFTRRFSRRFQPALAAAFDRQAGGFPLQLAELYVELRLDADRVVETQLLARAS